MEEGPERTTSFDYSGFLQQNYAQVWCFLILGGVFYYSWGAYIRPFLSNAFSRKTRAISVAPPLNDDAPVTEVEWNAREGVRVARQRQQEILRLDAIEAQHRREELEHKRNLEKLEQKSTLEKEAEPEVCYFPPGRGGRGGNDFGPLGGGGGGSYRPSGRGPNRGGGGGRGGG
eukprot:TRINITY_DN2531_c0_g1_i2.p1 TRINITY_DN2531_c0_g1~~TRINITY_DN2531_c0_g1_i2.p1  ORF type:complete len:173 (-),score=40.72 TRINITY_DN2531_c0_g1_i2:289-807(-)